MENDEWLSSTFDQNTTLRNRRFMNLNVQYGGGYRSFGLNRTVSGMENSMVIELVVN